MGRPDYIFGQFRFPFRETARCRDAQHGDGVCCALAPQLALMIFSWNNVYVLGKTINFWKGSVFFIWILDHFAGLITIAYF